MASCSTSNSNSLSGNLLPQLASKQRPFELCTQEASCSESTTSDDDYIFSDFKSLAAKDEKLRELLPHLEALQRVKSYMKAFLERKAEKVRRGEDVDSTDSEDEDTEKVFPFTLVRFYQNKTEMIKLQLRSFIFKLWLRRIDLTRSVDEDKYSSLQDFEHAIHNARENIKEYRDFIYKEYHNQEELQQMCPFYEESLEKALGKVLEEKSKAGFEMTEEDFVRFDCHASRLCALLGLRLDFLDRLKEMPPEHRHHRTLSDWIEIFLEKNLESATSTDRNSLTKELLVSMGFDPLSAAVKTIMARSFTSSAQHHIEACEWAKLFIADEFKYNPLLSPLSFRFPFQSNLTNTWFQLPSIADDESESIEDPCHVNIKNLETKASHASRLTQSTLSDFVLQDERNIILYHGTDHHSAADILVRGIDLCAGRQKRDFSCGSGFYLTDSSDDALNWATSTTAKPAILVFQVTRDHLDETKKLSLFENEERWRQVVFSFRTGQGTARTRKSLSSYDLIEGPVATVTRSDTSEELLFEPKPSSYQMCLISDDFAEDFQQNLHSILFFDISETNYITE